MTAGGIIGAGRDGTIDVEFTTTGMSDAAIALLQPHGGR